jgi:hypothetical protein
MTFERNFRHTSYFLLFAVLSNFYAVVAFSPADKAGPMGAVSALETEFSPS